MDLYEILLFLGITVAYFIVKAFSTEEIQPKRSYTIKETDVLDGYEFEHYLKDFFEDLGYQSQVTIASSDYGADLILEGKNKKIVVQAKRYSTNVGLGAVQEVYAAQAYYNADEAWVVTNSFYTKSAIELARACDVRLIDRTDLIQAMKKLKS